MLKGVTLRNRLTGEERIIETSFLFLCLGGAPNTEWAEEVGIARDEEGHLVTGPDLHKFRSFEDLEGGPRALLSGNLYARRVCRRRRSARLNQARRVRGG